MVDAENALEQVSARYPGVPVGPSATRWGAASRSGWPATPASARSSRWPWVERTDVAHGHPGLRALVMHGTRDRITSPRNARAMAEAMGALGADVTWRPVEEEAHSMLRQAGLWHRESARFLAEHMPATLR